MIRNLLLFMLLVAAGVAAAMLLGWLPVSTQNMETMAPSSDGAGSAPTNSFVVCPGHPRCPKGANDDKTEAPRQDH